MFGRSNSSTRLELLLREVLPGRPGEPGKPSIARLNTSLPSTLSQNQARYEGSCRRISETDLPRCLPKGIRGSSGVVAIIIFIGSGGGVRPKVDAECCHSSAAWGLFLPCCSVSLDVALGNGIQRETRRGILQLACVVVRLGSVRCRERFQAEVKWEISGHLETSS